MTVENKRILSEKEKEVLDKLTPEQLETLQRQRKLIGDFHEAILKEGNVTVVFAWNFPAITDEVGVNGRFIHGKHSEVQMGLMNLLGAISER